MEIGCIADVHGNLPALDAVLSDMPAVEQLVCAGDVVGYNPWPAACVATIRDRGVPTVQGNHDRAVAADTGFAFNPAASAGVDHARRTLDADALEWLASLPPTRTVADGTVRIAHGHPADPNRYTYPDAFSESMLGVESLLVLGHTHVQGFRSFDSGIICNPGSVGQPRDGDPRAAYTIVDLEKGTVDERRVSYDIDAVAAEIENAGLPPSLADRLYEGR